MLIIKIFVVSLTAMLLTGFSWGADPCSKAVKEAEQLASLRDDAKFSQIENRIQSLCPGGAATHYATALKLERAGNVDGAISEYRRALGQESAFPLASGNLGLLYAKKGMNDEASVELAKGLSSISDPHYHKAMGHILAERKVYPLAIHHLSEAGRELSGDAEIFTALADTYAADKQPEKALGEYRRALAAEPGNAKARIGIAAIYLERNEQDKALEELKKAALNTPQNREVHLMMAGIYEKKGDARLAEYESLLGGKVKTAALESPRTPEQADDSTGPEDIDKAARALKASLKNSPGKATEIYEKLGQLYQAAGRDAEAIAAYREAAHRNSPNSDIYLNLGILYEKQSLLDEAAVSYKRAIKANPDNADAYLRLAEIRNLRGLHHEAVQNYSEFLRLKPDSPDVQLKLARVFVKSNENTLAIAAYNVVLKKSPGNVDANREIASLYRLKGENDRAIEHYKKVLDQQKDDMDTRGALVALYVKKKQYGEVDNLLKEAVELAPEDSNNHYKLGLIQEFRKDYENAIDSYRKAVDLKPDNARALNAIGRLYMKTGRFAEAREALEAAKSADPNLEETIVLLNNIRDEFSPAPRKINKNLKSSKSRKSKKSKKAVKTKKPKAAKKKTAK